MGKIGNPDRSRVQGLKARRCLAVGARASKEGRTRGRPRRRVVPPRVGRAIRAGGHGGGMGGRVEVFWIGQMDPEGSRSVALIDLGWWDGVLRNEKPWTGVFLGGVRVKGTLLTSGSPED
jgi:hypothetical protein